MYKAISDRELNYLTTQLVSKIDNKIDTTNVVAEPSANKILRLDEVGKFPANILNGTIPIENIPHGALERCVIVFDDEARFALTTNTIQIGDTVKVTTTNKMFYVKDTENLNNEAGYEIYSSGSAEKLTNPRNIKLSGDASGNVNFDGTADVELDVVVNKLSGEIVLSNKVYSDIFPDNAVKGRLFLKRVPGNSISTEIITLDSKLYGESLPAVTNESDIYFVRLNQN